MFRFEIALFLLMGTYATEDITAKRKNILKELSVIVLNGFHFCHSAANYSRGTQEDVIRFWEPNYPLQHTEFGCAAMCVTIVLHLANDGGDINLRSAAAFLKYKGADEEMIKVMYDLGLYCRDTISLLNVTVEPCWIALEYLRCVRDGVEDLGWVPNAQEVNQEYSKYLVQINQEAGKKLHGKTAMTLPDGSSIKWHALDMTQLLNMRRMLPIPASLLSSTTILPDTTKMARKKEFLNSEKIEITVG